MDSMARLSLHDSRLPAFIKTPPPFFLGPKVLCMFLDDLFVCRSSLDDHLWLFDQVVWSYQVSTGHADQVSSGTNQV